MVHLIEDPALRNRRAVFRDRSDAGRHLGAFVKEHCPGENPGSVRSRQAAFQVQCPALALRVWNQETGFGSMTWNRKISLNLDLVRILKPHPRGDSIG
ncbi:MAG TPA: hypothetical protein PLV96_05140 [Methanoregulaceae archaeon]|nr:hypothetical protein [Methanoregulaceae archaeon]